MSRSSHRHGSLLHCTPATPQSEIKDFCQLPLHRGALGAAAPQQLSADKRSFTEKIPEGALLLRDEMLFSRRRFRNPSGAGPEYRWVPIPSGYSHSRHRYSHRPSRCLTGSPDSARKDHSCHWQNPEWAPGGTHPAAPYCHFRSQRRWHPPEPGGTPPSGMFLQSACCSD